MSALVAGTGCSNDASDLLYTLETAQSLQTCPLRCAPKLKQYLTPQPSKFTLLRINIPPFTQQVEVLFSNNAQAGVKSKFERKKLKIF